MPDGKPDFSGIYTQPSTVNATGPRGNLIFTRPFSQDFELTLRPDWEQVGLLEYVCEENNRCAGGNCRQSDVQ